MIHNLSNEGIAGEYPDNMVITVSFGNQDDNMMQLVSGFRHFAAACGFSYAIIDKYISDLYFQEVDRHKDF